MTAALLRMGRIKGVNRPAVATPIPVPGELPTVLLDAGANAEVQPEWLVQFAQMGSVYARHRFGIAVPRVGLLSIGEEPGKGDTLRKETFELLTSAAGINFVGNVEGRDVMTADIDVVVTDGFTGNVVLKTAEGVAREILGMLRCALTRDFLGKLTAGVLRPRLIELRERVDPENYGGSFLLGVRGSVVIGHGNSGARGVENALVGVSRAGTGLSDALEEALAAARATGETT
jgi:glycerol-3-phosphate acyltransferase PlsX